MTKFKLDIATPDGEVFSGDCESLTVPTETGEREFLAGHIDFVAPLGTGKARIKVDGIDRYASVSRGIIAVRSGQVSLAAVTFEFADDIDVERAKRAKEMAEEKLRSLNDDKGISLAKAKLARSLSRINVGERYKSK